MNKIQIFEPAMCCNSGFSGVGIDSELMRISTVIKVLSNNNIIVDRFNLSKEPQKFTSNSEVLELIKEKGTDILPITTVNDKVTIIGRYPNNEEFTKYLNIDVNILNQNN